MKPSLHATLRKLYEAVAELEAMFPGRPFTPDGHMVGSLGECLVAENYDLRLMKPSNAGFDAMNSNDLEVEIKATQGKSVAFRSEPQHCIAIKILKTGEFEEIYNGPGKPIWDMLSTKPLPSNGQYQNSLTRLAQLQKTIPGKDKVPRKL